MTASKDKTAADFLNDAAKIMEERGKQYDKPDGERSMGRCVTAFNAITGRDLTEGEGWLLLQVLKDVRQWQRPGFHQDSAEDCVAYAALKAEAKQREAGEVEAPQKHIGRDRAVGRWWEPVKVVPGSRPIPYNHLALWGGYVPTVGGGGGLQEESKGDR